MKTNIIKLRKSFSLHFSPDNLNCSVLILLISIATFGTAYSQANEDDLIPQQMLECEGNAGMIFVNKAEICNKLLNPNKPRSIGKYIKKNKDLGPGTLVPVGKEYIISSKPTKKYCKGANDNETVLSGYYIIPTYNGSPYYDPMNSSNLNAKLLFFPVWTYSNNSGSHEVITNPIDVTYKYHSLSVINTTPQDLNGVVLSASTVINTSPIDHSIFQWHSEAIQDYFGKAFISYYEISNIINNCDYLGITGALLNTGKLVPQSYTDSEPENLENICPNVYFTYRFIGFKIADSDYCSDGICLQKANTTITKSNGVNVEFNHDIPTEAWAAPCPPMWTPF